MKGRRRATELKLTDKDADAIAARPLALTGGVKQQHW